MISPIQNFTGFGAPGDHAEHLLLVQGHLHNAADPREHNGDLSPPATRPEDCVY